ncbi:26S proteasome regulatory subunit 6A homolog [Spinacia oleracea]|uniref:26S proteasome regulatory subunit 6A homolog n=1 Tax=Spinacia oleracea TaxID=3562 RepID=A0A9R0J3I2_SPIOL|nr:26S proteasome regulatory subunit 6A homolog [Spinacia oleracea]
MRLFDALRDISHLSVSPAMRKRIGIKWFFRDFRLWDSLFETQDYMFIGDGAKLVRDAFELAKEKAPWIIFIDEIDATSTKRFDSEVSGDREVQRTMLELLNQLDGFSSDERIKVIAATNRADILDPVMRSGRLDRKIEFPHPTEEARARILQGYVQRAIPYSNEELEETQEQWAKHFKDKYLMDAAE